MQARALGRLQLIEDRYEELRRAEGNWLAGASAAWANYQQEASNYGRHMGRIVETVVRGLEDASVKFTTTGKLSFSDFTRSVLADLVRAAKQAAVGVANAISSIWGGGAGAYTRNGACACSVRGFGNNLDNFRAGRGYSAGVYTGQGGVNEPAGIVRKGEVVWSQRDVARAGGADIVEAMRRGLPGCADGGTVGQIPARSALSRHAAGQGNLIVEINNSTNAKVEAREQRQTAPDGSEIRMLIHQCGRR